MADRDEWRENEEGQPDKPGFVPPEVFGMLASVEQYRQGFIGVVDALHADTEEDTLFLQLLLSEVGLISLALLVTERLFWELSPVCRRLQQKLIDVSAGQEFFDRFAAPPNEG